MYRTIYYDLVLVQQACVDFWGPDVALISGVDCIYISDYKRSSNAKSFHTN